MKRLISDGTNVPGTRRGVLKTAGALTSLRGVTGVVSVEFENNGSNDFRSVADKYE